MANTQQEDVEIARFRQTFQKLSGPDMEIDAWELQDILNASLRTDLRGERFSVEACKSMVALTDEDRTGKLGFEEFRALWGNIIAWKNYFVKADTDRSGNISARELRAALSALGYQMSNETYRALGMQYGDKEGNLSLATFIHIAIRVRFMYNKFQSKNRGDKARFNLEELMMLHFYS